MSYCYWLCVYYCISYSLNVGKYTFHLTGFQPFYYMARRNKLCRDVEGQSLISDDVTKQDYQHQHHFLPTQRRAS